MSKFNIGDTVYGIYFGTINDIPKIEKGIVVAVKKQDDYCFEYFIDSSNNLFEEKKLASSLEELEIAYNSHYKKLLKEYTHSNQRESLKALEILQKNIIIAFDNYRKGDDTMSDKTVPQIPEKTIKEQKLIEYQKFLSCEIKDTIEVLEKFNDNVLHHLPYKPEHPHQFISQIEALEQMKKEITTFRKTIENKNESWFMWKEFTGEKD